MDKDSNNGPKGQTDSASAVAAQAYAELLERLQAGDLPRGTNPRPTRELVCNLLLVDWRARRHLAARSAGHQSSFHLLLENYDVCKEDADPRTRTPAPVKPFMERTLNDILGSEGAEPQALDAIARARSGTQKKAPGHR